jgi:hypothetical protein
LAIVFVVEVELPEDEFAKLEAFVEAKCLDREKYLKKLLADNISAVFKKWERASTRAKRANATAEEPACF